MRSEVILVKNEGFVVPTTLNEAALSNNTSAHGVAYVDPKDGLTGEGKPGVPLLSELEENQTAGKGVTVVYHLCESVGEVKEEDLQPYALVMDGDTPICVGCLAGDFEVDNDGQFSSSYVFVEQYLRPTLEAMWAASEKHVPKFVGKLNSKLFRANLEGQCTPNKSTIVLLLSTGEALIFSKSDASLSGDWGFTSDRYNIKEDSFPVKEVPKSAVQGVTRRIGAASRNTADAGQGPSETVKPVEPIKAEPGVPYGTPPVKTEPNAPATEQRKIGAASAINKGPTTSDLTGKTSTTSTAELVWVVPPKDMGHKKLKDWYYKNNATVVPENLKERPPIRMLKEKAVKMSSVQIVDGPKEGTYKAFSDLPKKDIETHHIPQAEVPKGPVAGPVIAVAELEKVNTLLQNSKRIMDPKEWETLENKNPTFWDGHGISRERAQHLTMEVREAIARVSPQDAARGWMNADWKCLQLTNELVALKAKHQPAKEEVSTVPAEQPKRRVIGAAARAA